MSTLEQIQKTEFTRLHDGGHIYVDYTGGGQCPESVLKQYYELVKKTAFGNPHSYNPTSLNTTKLVNEARTRVLKFFGGGDEYECIFTPNASGALKIVGESYPWTENTTLILSRDNHNSVLGMREYAKRAGASIIYWELDNELRLEKNVGELITSQKEKGKDVVVAFPAQSNFSGVIHPMEYVSLAHELGAEVIVDTAAFVPTHPYNLQEYRPEVACISFYKILGFPTGIGALIIRKDYLKKMQKAWFAGGTVRGVSLEAHVLEEGYEAFEDGTINYALIPALTFVFDFIDSIGGIKVIDEHVRQMTILALDGLKKIDNVILYGPHSMESRGATIAFNILNENGAPIAYETIEKFAYEKGISLRGGCFCNPGSGSRAFELDGSTMQHLLEKLQSAGKSEVGVPGAIRISFGITNTAEDIQKIIAFIESVPRAAVE